MMNASWLNRRDFHKLAVAALGGILTGSMSGCGGRSTMKDPPFGELHVCRGLNACRGTGNGGKNECAGRGQCATIKQDCAGKNKCKNQGGCGTNPAANDCAGKGGCAMPLMADAWTKARQRFEAEMAHRGISFGEAPAAPKS
jgi:hypothetical protein